MNIIFPMSGQGTRFQKVGYKCPKPLIPINGRTLVDRQIDLFPESVHKWFVLAENHKGTELIEKINDTSNSHLDFVSEHKKGPAIAILKAIEKIPSDEPLLIMYCDFGMYWDYRNFEKFVRDSDCDSCLISYRGFHPHYQYPQQYAYSRLENELVKEVKEKGSFTSDREKEFASAGAYYFKNSKILKQAIEYQIENDFSYNGEFYTSLTVEALIRRLPNAQVRVYEIPYFYQWGTPQDVWDFEYWEKAFQKRNQLSNKRGRVSQILLPMAGSGSRFKTVEGRRKPHILIHEQLMFQKALSHLPKSTEKPVVVTLPDSKEFFPLDQYRSIVLDSTPPGQAYTMSQGISALSDRGDILISACDHGVVIDPQRLEILQNSSYDAAIITVKGFSGVQRTPHSYSYVVTHNRDSQIEDFERVSVKSPVSDTPTRDHLLIGTFWFRSKALLSQALDWNDQPANRVNGELYFDSAFNALKSKGVKVGVLESEGYFNWGDPGSLKEYYYWYDVFTGQFNRFKGV